MALERKHVKESSTVGAGVVLLIALVGMVNYFGWKYHQRFDWTRSELYSLSEKSQGLMSALDTDIEAVVFMSPAAPLYDAVRELLSRYESASHRFSVRHVDPAKNLIEAQELVDRFQLSQVDVVVFDRSDDRRIVESADLADYDYSGLQMGQGPEMTGFKGEQAFTGAILELIEDSKPRILFTVGHGELRLDEFSARGLSQMREILGRDNFEIDEWTSLGEGRIPEGTSLIVIAGPTRNFLEPELAILQSYLENGGRLLVLLDPLLDGDGGMDETGLEALLEGFGVAVGSDIVVDPSNPIPFYGAETIFVDSYGQHPVTQSLQQAAVPVILPLARSVGRGAPGDDVVVTELFRTSPEGWGERALGDLGRVERDAEDLAGPVSIGVAVSLAADGGADAQPQAGSTAVRSAMAPSGMRLIVFGDSDCATNAQLMNVGNTELVLNVVNWLIERESLLGIPPKEPEQVRLTLSRSQLRATAWLVFGVLPGAALLTGALVFVRRRR